MEYSEQAVIITGAGGNVGSAIALELAARGAKLALADASEEALQRTSARLPTNCERLLLGGVDLRQQSDAARVANEAAARFGRVDALANTVGTFRMGRIDAEAVEQWSLLMELNAFSALLLCRVVAPIMARNSYGRMLHVAAAAGLRGAAEMSAYSASKAALMRVIESAAVEYRAAGITANCILPTTIDTPQNRAAMPDADASAWIKPETIAKSAALLLSRDAGAITGAAIPLHATP